MLDLLLQQTDFFNSGQTKDVNFRKQKLQALRKSILAHEKDIIEALHQDFKKSAFETIASEIGVVIDEINLHIKKIKSWHKARRVMPALVNFPSSAKVYPEPYGKVLIISPWNYPFNLAMIPLIGAVSAGNTVVLKPSEYSSNTAKVIQTIINEVFDNKHVAVIQGDAQIARDLLAQKWQYIFFTGSTAVGKYVYQAAAKNLTPLTLELGGKSPVVIDQTAQLKLAAKRIVWGKFINAGQTCIAPDYILIDEKVHQEFINYLQAEIIKTYGEDAQKSADFPRIINQQNFNRLSSALKNQPVIFGGKTDASDLFIAPSLLLNPDLNSELMQYEIFGPILPIITYKTQAEMGKVLAQHPEPLAFYIFSTDKKQQQYLIKKYAFGGGVINDVVVHFVNNRLAFGGVGASGLGAYHGKHSFDTFSHHKSVVKRSNWLDIPFRYAPATAFKEKMLRFFLMK
jgi:aldehyde dehydrogenase (NAD+)